MKQTKTSSVSWIQLPLDLLSDLRVGKLVAEQGIKGFGIYMSIVLELYRQGGVLTIDRVKAIKHAGQSQIALTIVLNNYDLFSIDANHHVRSVIDYRGFAKKSVLRRSEDLAPTVPSVTLTDTLTDAVAAPARIKRETRDIRENNDCRRYKSTDAADGLFALHGATRVASLDEIFAELAPWNQWAEIIAMKSGFSRLLQQHWDETLRWFRQHITERGREGEMLSTSDAKRYLSDIVNHPRSREALRSHLADYDGTHRRYPFEDATSGPGHRSYDYGRPLPDTAPPRPDEWAIWDDIDQEWRSGILV